MEAETWSCLPLSRVWDKRIRFSVFAFHNSVIIVLRHSSNHPHFWFPPPFPRYLVFFWFQLTFLCKNPVSDCAHRITFSSNLPLLFSSRLRNVRISGMCGKCGFCGSAVYELSAHSALSANPHFPHNVISVRFLSMRILILLAACSEVMMPRIFAPLTCPPSALFNAVWVHSPP